MNRQLARVFTKVLIVVLGLLASTSWSQQITKMQRGEVLDMLQQISPDIKKHYYDPKLHGVNWDEQVALATQKIKTADSLPLASAAVAAALLSLNDSHTTYLPPAYSTHFDYGWQGQMIGDRCFVMRVRPGSQAEKKGVKPGDELMAMNGFAPDRDNYWKMQYAFHTLNPRPGLVLDLRNPAGQQRELGVPTTMIEKQHILDATAGDAGYSIWGHHPGETNRGLSWTCTIRGGGR